MFYHFKIHKEGKGYWAECVELAGCHTQADSLSKLKYNMEEALNLFLSEPENSKHLFPMPLKKAPKGRHLEKVHVNSSVAFSMLIRQTRIKKRLTLKEMASILNYKNINTYVKLERPATSNPELTTLSNIVAHFADFPISLVF